MRKHSVLLLASMLLFTISVVIVGPSTTYGQGSSIGRSWTPYDNFNQTFLDPAKWLQVPACRYWTSELECVRESQVGKLRLVVRNYGDRTSNVGSQYGNSELYFSNPSGVSGIRSQVVVRRAGAKACAGNAGEPSHTQAIVGGTFFNNGTGDVWVFLPMDHDSSFEPGFIWAGILIQHPSGQSDYADLGGFYAGEPVIAQLEWDKPNHRFFAQLTRIKTGEVFQQYLPYADSDTTPPSDSEKLLSVRTFSPNCIGDRTWADTEATFDDVWVQK
jgi:hypothetical protein